MKIKTTAGAMKGALLLSLLGTIVFCKTVPEAAMLDTSAITALIQAQSAGLSPNNDGLQDSIDFQLYAEQAESVKSWTVEIIHGTKGIQRTFSGRSDLPGLLSWDGQSRSGRAPEGPYSAALTLEYANGSAPVSAQSARFNLDISPPAIRVQISPVPFSPDGDGVDEQVTIKVQAQDESGIESWNIDILDPAGHPFTRFSGLGEPGNPLIWNGRSPTGELVQSADDYLLAASVRDTFGNTSRTHADIPVDVLVLRDGDRLKMVISSITFPPYSADFTAVSPQQAEENEKILQRVAQILRKFARYQISIEGHAVMVYWNDPARGEREQNEVLLPLSKARAEAVKTALSNLGIEDSRMSTQGAGGSRPVVPFGDLENRWKDRRVEFILVAR